MTYGSMFAEYDFIIFVLLSYLLRATLWPHLGAVSQPRWINQNNVDFLSQDDLLRIFFSLSLSLELTIWPGYLSISAATAAAASDFSACSQAHPAERWGNELCQKLGILTGAGAHTHLNT